MSARFRDIVIVALVISNLSVFIAWYQGYTLHQNVGQSLSYTFSLGKPFHEVKRGMYVYFSHSRFSGMLTKKVLGVPGDKIVVSQGVVSVGGQNLELVNSEKNLCPIQDTSIPEGFVFVAGTHPESCDSRYQEFGLIPISSIEEEVCPIF